MLIITILLFVCGVYIIFNSLKMKASGTIPKSLISNKINLERAKNIPGYISYMFPRGIIFGIALCIFSSVLIAGEFTEVNPVLMLIVQLGYFFGIIYYSAISIKAQNKFLF